MVPNTGISLGCLPQASLLRCTCLATSRSASSAPLRSNLLIATKSAKSSMSIFSSCEAAPNSGVITYSGTSTCGTMAASPWPMPLVSTMMRSKPAALHAASTSGKACEISLPKSRVASERMKTREPWLQGAMAFIRIRSPSSAPPDLRRDGSIDITAMRNASPWSKRMRRISSSVSEDLPAPPVPVIPITGIALFLVALCADRERARAGFCSEFSMPEMSWASLRQAASLCP